MLDKLNSIWKNLLLDIFLYVLLVATSLTSMLTNNWFAKDFNKYDYIATGLAIIFLLHLVFYFVLFIYNIVKKKYIKSLLCLVVSFTGYYLLMLSVGMYLMLRGGLSSDVDIAEYYSDTKEITKDSAIRQKITKTYEK